MSARDQSGVAFGSQSRDPPNRDTARQRQLRPRPLTTGTSAQAFSTRAPGKARVRTGSEHMCALDDQRERAGCGAALVLCAR